MTVFFFYPEKFKMYNSSRKNAWVSKNGVVFPPSEIEWVSGVWTFPGKKKTEFLSRFLGKKKSNEKIWNSTKGAVFVRFWPFFGGLPSLSWVSGLQTFPGKKKKTACFFFFPKHGKKKNEKCPKWVSEYPPNFSAEKKNTVPLVEPKRKLSNFRGYP